MSLPIGTYSLDGFVFAEAPGGAVPYILLEEGHSTSPMGIRHQDSPAPRGDYLHFGSDYYDPPEKTFIIGVDTSTDPLAVARLRSVWRADHIRQIPGATSVLRWNTDGTTYRAEGRARSFETIGQAHHDPDWTVVEVTFQLRDAYVMLDDLQSISLTINAAPTGTGIILPEILPWTLGAAPQERQDIFNFEATAPTPFEVVISAPVTGAATNIAVWGTGWQMQFPSVSLSSNEEIRVDTRLGTALQASRSIAGNLSIHSDIRATLPPGNNTFGFSCSDPSGTATATIHYRSSIPLI